MLEMTSEATMPETPAYSHSIKVSDSAKGIRLDCHVWANSLAIAIEECFNMYLQAKIKATQNNIPIAPVDVK